MENKKKSQSTRFSMTSMFLSFPPFYYVLSLLLFGSEPFYKTLVVLYSRNCSCTVTGSAFS